LAVLLMSVGTALGLPRIYFEKWNIYHRVHICKWNQTKSESPTCPWWPVWGRFWTQRFCRTWGSARWQTLF